jgi:hypothetical protein
LLLCSFSRLQYKLFLMAEMAHTGENHGDVGWLARRSIRSRTEPPGWTTAVTPALALLNRVGKGKKASEAITAPAAARSRPLDRDAHAVDPVGLPAADADGGFALPQHDGIGFDVLAGFPGKAQGGPFFGRWAGAR